VPPSTAVTPTAHIAGAEHPTKKRKLFIFAPDRCTVSHGCASSEFFHESTDGLTLAPPPYAHMAYAPSAPSAYAPQPATSAHATGQPLPPAAPMGFWTRV